MFIKQIYNSLKLLLNSNAKKFKGIDIKDNNQMNRLYTKLLLNVEIFVIITRITGRNVSLEIHNTDMES